jgi:hypothetical protein
MFKEFRHRISMYWVWARRWDAPLPQAKNRLAMIWK